MSDEMTPKPTATVIRRVVNGKDELVVVCERCDTIHTIGVGAAMQVALQEFLRWHDEERHRALEALA